MFLCKHLRNVNNSSVNLFLPSSVKIKLEVLKLMFITKLVTQWQDMLFVGKIGYSKNLNLIASNKIEENWAKRF